MKTTCRNNPAALTALLGLLVFLSACRVLPNDFETPSMVLVDLRALPSESIEQRFSISLRITNPNANALNLVGLSYAVELEGFELITGVANEIPSIPAYGDAVVQLEASVNLLDGMRLFHSLLTRPQAEINYSLGAKLDTGTPFIGKIPVTDTGKIRMDRLLTH